MAWDPNTAGSTAQSDDVYLVRKTANAVPSAARTVSGDSGALYVGSGKKVNLLLDVTAATGTTPSMALTVEWSHDETTWFPADPSDTLGASVTTPVKRVRSLDVKAQYYRVVWAITGTTPSFTFAVHAHFLD